MKKFFLFAAAAMVAASASAATENVIAEMYPGAAGLIGWGAEGLLEQVTEDGRDALKITNGEEKNSWEVQFAYDMEYVPGTTYYFTFDVKGDAGSVGSGFQCTDGYVGCGNMNAFNITGEWNTVTISGTAEEVDGKIPNRWVASVGNYVGTFYISNLKLYTLEEGDEPAPVDPTPDEPKDENVIVEMYPGNAGLIGWGGEATREVVTEDGREALKFTNPTEMNFWEVQMAYDMDYVPGTTYYISFDVKGDAGNITSGYQCTDGYVGCGDLSNFAITPEWNTVTISGEAKEVDGKVPNRWVINLGNYVGTFYISKLKIYTQVASGVEAPVAVENGRVVVYNLLGVKVLDTDDASMLNTLKKGIYVVNGKKVAL